MSDFIAWLGKQTTRPGNGVKHHVPLPLSAGYVSKVLSSGRAALKLAEKQDIILKAPFVPDVQTADDRRSADPKGRPITVREAAKLFDAAADAPDHVWRFLVTLACTVARPNAVLDLTMEMCRREAGYCNLLPPGRKQTKKRRGIIPICRTWEAWLSTWHEPGHIVAYERKKGIRSAIKSIDTAWKLLRARAFPPRPEQLSGIAPLETIPSGPERLAEARRRAMICSPEADGISPYSFRYTIPRHMRRSGVPGDQISIYLSHIVVSEHATTMIYSPHDPEYCRDAAAAIDAWCEEVGRLQSSQKRLSVARSVSAPTAQMSRQSSRQ